MPTEAQGSGLSEPYCPESVESGHKDTFSLVYSLVLVDLPPICRILLIYRTTHINTVCNIVHCSLTVNSVNTSNPLIKRIGHLPVSVDITIVYLLIALRKQQLMNLIRNMLKQINHGMPII